MVVGGGTVNRFVNDSFLSFRAKKKKKTATPYGNEQQPAPSRDHVATATGPKKNIGVGVGERALPQPGDGGDSLPPHRH